MTGVVIAIGATEKHPNLRDHERVLFVTSPDGSTRTLDLCPETGVGVHSNLYRIGTDKLVLVDANGVWVEIGPSGDLASVEWRWGRETPPMFLGTFCADEEQVYRLVAGQEKNVYLFKDPPDGVERDN